MKLGEYMQKHIFTPLGMKNTTFRPLLHPHIMSLMTNRPARNPETGKLEADTSGIFPIVSSTTTIHRPVLTLLRSQPKMTTAVMACTPAQQTVHHPPLNPHDPLIRSYRHPPPPLPPPPQLSTPHAFLDRPALQPLSNHHIQICPQRHPHYALRRLPRSILSDVGYRYSCRR